MVAEEKNLINLSFLYKKTMNDKNAAKELVGYFIKNVHFFLNESNRAIKEKELTSLCEFAQKIEIGAKNIHSDKIQAIASDIEFYSLENNFKRASDDLKLLDKTIKELIKFQKAM